MIVVLIAAVIAAFALNKYVFNKPKAEEPSSSQSESLTDIYAINESEAKATEELIQEYIDAHTKIANDCLMSNIDNVVGVKVTASDRYLVVEQTVDIDAERIDAYRWVFDNAIKNNNLPESMYAVLNDLIKYTGNKDVKINLTARTTSGAFIYENGVSLPEGYEEATTAAPVSVQRRNTLSEFFDDGVIQESFDIQTPILTYSVSYIDETTLAYTTTYLNDLTEEDKEDIKKTFDENDEARKEQYSSFVSFVNDYTNIDSLTVIFRSCDKDGNVLCEKTVSNAD